MTCPKCGNGRAECIIGNFWKCPACDATPPARAEQSRGRKLLERIERIVRFQWSPSRVATLSRSQLPPILGAMPIPLPPDKQHMWWRILLYGPGIERASHAPGEFIDYIDDCIGLEFDKILCDLKMATAGVKGVEVLYDFPHWVTDDGRIAVQSCVDEDAFELRMRAIWRPAP